MIIEFHDDEVDDVVRGTLLGRAGAGGTIEYAYQAEMWVQQEMRDVLSCPIVRAFAVGCDHVAAVWKRNADGTMSYVARSTTYDGEWQLPYVHPEAAAVATAMLGEDAASVDDASRWAVEQFRQRDVACAVLLDAHGVVMAWERGSEGPVVVARGPRPFPVRTAASN